MWKMFPETLRGRTMKPIVGIGTETKFGTVVSIHNDYVVVDRQGVKDKVSFRRIEKTVLKEKK